MAKMTANEEEIFDFIKMTLIEFFEIDDSKITMQANLYEDLEIDSIDAIDLIDHIKKKTGYRLEATDFQGIKTLGDVVKIVSQKMDEATKAEC